MYVATGGSDCILRLWRVKYVSNNINGVILEKQMGPHLGQINGVVFSAASDLVFSASSDKTCRVFSVKDGKQLHCLSFSVPNIGHPLDFRACR